jgi:alginate O-acetyltransferase complex protein AlgI
LTGIWHGASWNFVVWGLYFAILLIAEKFALSKLPRWERGALWHVYALLFIVIGWVIFRSEDLGYATRFIARMFNPFAAGGTFSQVRYLLVQYLPEWIAALVFSLPIARFLTERFAKQSEWRLTYIVRAVFVFAVFALSVISLISSGFNPFIYFRF